MILRATKYAETGEYASPFKHILVDEFQDISRSRGRLVKALKAQHSDARIFAVGDLAQLRRKFSDLHISFRTIHASKGLEADHVVILNMFRGRTSFPSEIVDDPLLSLVSPEAEPFENAEERRVMYVALTRARKSVTLMGSALKQSAFVSELLDDPEYGTIGASDQLEFNHICGECGGHLVPVPTKDGRTWYRCEHATLCGHSLNACASCGVGLPVRNNRTGVSKCSCGAEYPSCPSCEDGWLVERKGRFGAFLGCVSYPRCNGKAKTTKTSM